MRFAMATRACRGDAHCGDAGAKWAVGDHTMLCLVDGLGHGRPAEVAAHAALDYVAASLEQPLQQIFAGCDRAIATTRGVAMALARVDAASECLEYAAIGNIRAMLRNGDQCRFIGNWPGIVGGGYRRLQPERISFTRDEQLYLYTDGLPRFLDTGRWPRKLDLQGLANFLVREFGRRTDDSAVIIYQHAEANP